MENAVFFDKDGSQQNTIAIDSMIMCASSTFFSADFKIFNRIKPSGKFFFIWCVIGDTNGKKLKCHKFF